MNIQRGSLLASAEQVQGLPIVIDVLRAVSSIIFRLVSRLQNTRS